MDICRQLVISAGEGNGSPLQCSCLENPRDRGAWWAAIYGVARTWLKWFRSSSNLRYTAKLSNAPDYLTPLLLLLSHFNRLQLSATPWTIAVQTPLSTGFSTQEYRSGLPCSPLGDLPKPGIKPRSPEDRFFTTEPPGKTNSSPIHSIKISQFCLKNLIDRNDSSRAMVLNSGCIFRSPWSAF